MRNLISTLPVRLGVEELWAGLRHKAEHPVAYVPAITACTVLERTANGLVREITLGGTVRQRERVTFEPMSRIVFEQLTDPDLDTITNRISVDGRGVALTLDVALSPAGLARAQRDPEFSSETEAYFAGTLKSIVAELHRNRK